MAKVAIVVTITAVNPNGPPQYTGPEVIDDLVVGVGRQLDGFDPDGDAIAWSIDPNDESFASVSSSGVLIAKAPTEGRAITVWLDDGKSAAK